MRLIYQNHAGFARANDPPSHSAAAGGRAARAFTFCQSNPANNASNWAWLTDLALYERNARTHPQDQIEEIKASIRAFGFTNPILADLEDGGVIAAGHGRHMAVEQMYDADEEVRLPNGKALPAGCVPVIDCSAWSEAQRRA